MDGRRPTETPAELFLEAMTAQHSYNGATESLYCLSFRPGLVPPAGKSRGVEIKLDPGVPSVVCASFGVPHPNSVPVP